MRRGNRMKYKVTIGDTEAYSDSKQGAIYLQNQNIIYNNTQQIAKITKL